MTRPPVPPFTEQSAIEKVRAAENSWNSRDPNKVALAYTADSEWRNRSSFLRGRTEIVRFLTNKWAHEHEYRLIKELWAFCGNRIAVRFAYEWREEDGAWFRSYGNENWEFDASGLMNGASPASTTCPSPRLRASSAGHWAPGRTAIRGSPTSACDAEPAAIPSQTHRVLRPCARQQPQPAPGEHHV